MNISGLVVTANDPDIATGVARIIRSAGPFTLGEQLGPRLTMTLETADDHASADWFDWVSNLDGVIKADVAFVYFDSVEEADHG